VLRKKTPEERHSRFQVCASRLPWFLLFLWLLLLGFEERYPLCVLSENLCSLCVEFWEVSGYRLRFAVAISVVAIVGATFPAGIHIHHLQSILGLALTPVHHPMGQILQGYFAVHHSLMSLSTLCFPRVHCGSYFLPQRVPPSKPNNRNRGAQPTGTPSCAAQKRFRFNHCRQVRLLLITLFHPGVAPRYSSRITPGYGLSGLQPDEQLRVQMSNVKGGNFNPGDILTSKPNYRNNRNLHNHSNCEAQPETYCSFLITHCSLPKDSHPGSTPGTTSSRLARSGPAS